MARAFDPETVDIIAAAYDAAWQEIEAAAAKPMPHSQRTEVSTALTKHIIAAVEAGERDPDTLKLLALEAMKSR